MFINGNEVNHLFLKGQQFDLSYSHLAAKIVDPTGRISDINLGERVNADNTIALLLNNNGSQQTVKVGSECWVLARFMDYVYIAVNDSSNWHSSVDAGNNTGIGWIPVNNIELLN